MNKYTEIGIVAALNAGNELMKGFGNTFEIKSKEGINNLVTEYDYKAEKIIIDTISAQFPKSYFVAEESGFTGSESSELRWIIDPLDGTVNFANNLPIFSISIAAEYQGELVSGVIFQPATNELFYADKGNGAYYNGKKIKVNEHNNLAKAFIVTGFPYEIVNDFDIIMTQFAKVIQNGMPVRRLGSAALDLAYVACGRFDVFWEMNLNPWDVAAGCVIVREAGGVVANYSGKEFNLKDKSILASNRLMHNDFVKLLNS